MAWQDARGAKLAAEVRRAAEAWRAGDREALTDAAFNRLALALFAFQFASIAPYRRYCRQLGRTPDRVADWREVPGVPTPVFRELPIVCQPPERCEAVFRTSGTTGGEERRGRHFMVSLALYETLLLAGFAGLLRPAPPTPPEVIILHPSRRERPASSLGHYFHTLAARYARPPALWALSSGGLDAGAVARRVQGAQAAKRPVWLLATSAALAGLLSRLGEEGPNLRLPPGSLVLETGGYKGAAEALTPQELRQLAVERLGCPPAAVVSQYGMTELTSQCYSGLRLAVPGEAGTAPGVYVGPPWLRVQLLDPAELRPLQAGEPGLIQLHDLGNVGSAGAVLTADLGQWAEGPVPVARGGGWGRGLRLLGRARGAAARGCSLAAAEILEGVGEE